MAEGLSEGGTAALRGFGFAPVQNWMAGVLGLDRAIRLTTLARVWASTTGFVTVVLIVRFLSPAEQGYYYTFGSLVALQIMFEVGFSFVILQVASHERAHLDTLLDYEITGRPVAHARLARLFSKRRLQLGLLRYRPDSALFLWLPSAIFVFPKYRRL